MPAFGSGPSPHSRPSLHRELSCIFREESLAWLSCTTIKWPASDYKSIWSIPFAFVVLKTLSQDWLTSIALTTNCWEIFVLRQVFDELRQTQLLTQTEQLWSIRDKDSNYINISSEMSPGDGWFAPRARAGSPGPGDHNIAMWRNYYDLFLIY